MSLTNKAMILNLQIGLWSGHKLDKEKSAEVTRDAGAQTGAARVNKHLIAKEVMSPITQAASAVRTHFYGATLPWKDNGDRLLTRVMYMGFMEEHGRRVQEFKDAVHHFTNFTYPGVRDQAEFRMGELFKPDDYPHAEDIERKFYVTLDIDAITEAGDFRVQGLDSDDVDRIKGDMEQAMQVRITKAMGDVWKRLADTLGYFSERMNSDGVFRDSTVNNLKEIAALLPGLNLTGDPALAAIGHEISVLVGQHDPKDIRKDPELREAIGREAQDIIDNMKGFMNAFGTTA